MMGIQSPWEPLQTSARSTITIRTGSDLVNPVVEIQPLVGSRYITIFGRLDLRLKSFDGRVRVTACEKLLCVSSTESQKKHFSNRQPSASLDQQRRGGGGAACHNQPAAVRTKGFLFIVLPPKRVLFFFPQDESDGGRGGGQRGWGSISPE